MCYENTQDITNDIILYVTPTATTYIPISNNNSQDLTDNLEIYVTPIL